MATASKKTLDTLAETFRKGADALDSIADELDDPALRDRVSKFTKQGDKLVADVTERAKSFAKRFGPEDAAAK